MLLPFQGLFYNLDLISSFADVIAPPYDVISKELQNQLFKKSEFNFCRLDLPVEEGPERYRVAKETWENWRSEQIIIQDKRPAIYLHHHSFYLESGRKIVRQGFFAACELADFSSGKILPHEKTLDAPKQDRLEMTRATHAQLSPVFSLYDDPENQIDSLFADLGKTTPSYDFTTSDNERHQIWKLFDPAIISKISDCLAKKHLFIADGHHRYETALNYRNELLEKNPHLPAQAAARYILMYCVNLNDNGLVVLPIHRCVRDLPNFSSHRLIQNLESEFEIKTFPRDLWQQARQEQNDLANSHHAFLLIPKSTESENIFLISMEHHKALDLAQKTGQSSVLANLDVTVLHREILQNRMGMTESDLAQQKYLDYEKTTESAFAELEKGAVQAVFLLNPTRIGQMQAVAEAGLKMPQKSTFFYPKIASGLIIHDVEESACDGFGT